LVGVPIVVTSRRSLGVFKADKPHYLFMERLANRMTDLVVANAEAVKIDAIRQERLPSSRIRVVYNGIEPRLFNLPLEPTLRSSLEIPCEVEVLGVVANLIAYKGHRFLLEACHLVKQRYPRFVVLLIGEGPCRSELERLAKDLHLEAEIRFLGARQDVPRLLSVVGMVVLPSLHEGLPNAILEAMAAGKPVVATRVGGIPEAVVHGETGLLVPPADPGALAEAILALLGDPGRAGAMGRAGRDRVVKKFGMDRMVLETQKLYEELLAAKGD
jgi:glycosyltransferase involved in cell wall biosynthesis